jgi:serine O-acetyltransferase
MMIDTRKKLHEYLKSDSSNYQKRTNGLYARLKNNLTTNPISDQRYIWKYIKTLRYTEYYLNKTQLNKNKSLIKLFHVALLLFYLFRLRKIAYKTGFQIPPNTVGKGLTIWHWGSIIVNPNVTMGENAQLNPGVIIGHKNDGTRPPTIGDNVFVGGGAKIIGPICVGNNVFIAPNAVVVKDIPDFAVVAGIPAKIIKYNR